MIKYEVPQLLSPASSPLQIFYMEWNMVKIDAFEALLRPVIAWPTENCFSMSPSGFRMTYAITFEMKGCLFKALGPYFCMFPL